MTLTRARRRLCTVCLGLVLLGSGAVGAAPIAFDFTGPMVGSRDTLTFLQGDLVLTAWGVDLSGEGPAMVTQWEYGLGVRTDLPNNGNGDGALDSIGKDEQLVMRFTDLAGQPVSVQLDRLVFHAFGAMDDLTLWVDGVAAIGPDYHPGASPWDLSVELSAPARTGSTFAISVTDEGPGWEDDYFRVAGLAVSRTDGLSGASVASVPEPRPLALLGVALLLMAGTVARTRSRPLLRVG